MGARLIINEGLAKFGGEVKGKSDLGQKKVKVDMALPAVVVDEESLRAIHAEQKAKPAGHMPVIEGAHLPGVVGVKAEGGPVTIRVFPPNCIIGEEDAFIVLQDGQEFYTKTRGDGLPVIEVVAA